MLKDDVINSGWSIVALCGFALAPSFAACSDSTEILELEPGAAQCGTARCAPNTTDLGRLNACCSGPTACGLILPAPIGVGACVATAQPEIEGDCPPVPLPSLSATGSGDAGLFTVEGCCRAAGICGGRADDVLGLRLGLGCVDPAELAYDSPAGSSACGQPALDSQR